MVGTPDGASLGDLAGAESCLSAEHCLAHLTAQPCAGLRDPAALALQGHIDRCARCRVVMAEAARGLFDAAPQPAARSTRMFADGDRLDGRYEIRRLIAKGGMGEIYEAADLVLGETIALKTLALCHLDEEQATQRLLAEIHLARRVLHPNVCRLLELGGYGPAARQHRAEAGEAPFVTMELLDGETLAQRIARCGHFDVGAAQRVLRQVALGLAAVHRAGVVHGDLKSENIFLERGRDGVARVVIIDFGLARSLLPGAHRPPPRAAREVAGTVAYMAPEQLQGAEATPASDIYGLGVVVFQMVTGQLPFQLAPTAEATQAALAARIAGPPPLPSAIRRELGPAWDQLVARCLARDPAERFARAEQLLCALHGMPRQLPRPAPAGGATPSLQKGVRQIGV